MTQVSSESDGRTANNAVRHNYRILSEDEKSQMVAIKDKGMEFLSLLEGLVPCPSENELSGMTMLSFGQSIMSRELSIAKERIEEAVMWAVKHVTS